MSIPWSSRAQRALLNCAPIGKNQSTDRAMRAAISSANGSADFLNQRNFDRAVAEVVQLILIPPETAEWFSEQEALGQRKWTTPRFLPRV